jgi:SAM-dependent methyltransferase
LNSQLWRIVRTTWDYPSKVGDRLAWSWLTYNPGVFVEFAMVARRNAPIFCEALLASFPAARSVIDVGCGTGHFCRYLELRSRTAVGFEYSAIARLVARCLGVNARRLDLTNPKLDAPTQRADLAISLEVGEHVAAPLAPALVRFLCAASPTVVLTCAPPGQDGNGHVNCQPKDYWYELFAQRRYGRWPEKESELRGRLARETRLSPFLRDNLMILRAVDAP